VKFTVTWTTEASDGLCKLFMAAPDAAELTRIVNAIERELRQNPENVGESRDGSLRVAMQDHIGILFEISNADCSVQVIHIGWLP
jgi:hypothetical protein